jgi:hypothetical protein
MRMDWLRCTKRQTFWIKEPLEMTHLITAAITVRILLKTASKHIFTNKNKARKKKSWSPEVTN